MKEELKESHDKIRTNDMEETLCTLCTELGIEIVKGMAVTDLSELTKRFPDVKVVIGADGSHSTIRKLKFSNDLSTDEDLQILVEVKYEAFGKTEGVDMLTTGYKTMKIIGHTVFETVGSENSEGMTPITLQLFVDKTSGAKLKHATFKNPLLLCNQRDEIPNDILNSIETWLSIRKLFANENRNSQSENYYNQFGCLRIENVCQVVQRRTHVLPRGRFCVWCALL